EISVGKSCIFNVIKNTTAMTSCPNNFCFDVNPKFRFIATIIKSSKNPIKPYPINTNSNNQNSYVIQKLKSRTLANIYVIIILIKSSKNTNKPYPINTNRYIQNSYVIEKLKRRTL